MGVSLTGICDNPSIINSEVLNALREEVIQTNQEWAERLGIEASAATTCVKPSGTVSQLVDSASGLHARHSPYYLRTIRADNKDPVTGSLKAAGVYWEADVMAPDSTTVFYFPRKSPEGSVYREELDAIKSLELWETLQDAWCEHKPSATIYVKEDEWMKVGSWVYDKFDKLSGVSFLPFDGGTYKQAPYQVITEEEYNQWLIDHPLPEIDWSDMRHWEWEDNTTGAQELACTAGSCEIISVGELKDG